MGQTRKDNDEEMPHGTWAFQKRKGRSMSGLFQCGRCEGIRTSDPFVPNEVRYQAALHTDVCGTGIYRKPRLDTSLFYVCKEKNGCSLNYSSVLSVLSRQRPKNGLATLMTKRAGIRLGRASGDASQRPHHAPASLPHACASWARGPDFPAATADPPRCAAG